MTKKPHYYQHYDVHFLRDFLSEEGIWLFLLLDLYFFFIQQISAFYEDNFPEVMKNVLVIKGVFTIFLKLSFTGKCFSIG